jgi:hypothetical protein
MPFGPPLFLAIGQAAFAKAPSEIGTGNIIPERAVTFGTSALLAGRTLTAGRLSRRGAGVFTDIHR